ncbi:MAG: hypothetical protein Q7R47_02480, partial [Candidatus Diapherotrites archaeon]|nr:hypothetical protein [Candidatus Diapherotrites archaeon]
LWGQPINGAFASAFLNLEGGTNKDVFKETARSATVNLDPWGTGETDVFLDLRDVKTGRYDLNVVTYFGTETAWKVFKVDVYPAYKTGEKPADDNWLLYVGIGLLVLIILLLGVFLLRSRKKSR